MACNTPALSLSDSPKNSLYKGNKSKSGDYSKRGLRAISQDIYENLKILQYLYLEDNFLECLPDTFFTDLYQLKWLDLRNNYLRTLPTTGLSSHTNLEVILLKSNLIQILPPELGCVINLKGLQIVDNPIENIPFQVISLGFPSVISYLRKLCNYQTPLLPVSETIITNPTHKETDGESGDQKSNPERKIRQTNFIECLEEALNAQNYNNETNKWKKFKRKNSGQMTLACRRLSRSTVNSYSTKLTTTEKIRFHEIEDCERAKLKETLQKQAKLLQRIKDVEAVKVWRKMITNEGPRKLLDNYQYSPSQNFIDKSPFDVDQDMLKMLNRIDLYKSIKEIEENEQRKIVFNRKRSTANPQDIESQMNRIRIQLEKMDFAEKNYTETKKHFLTSRIQEINKLRDTLKKLHRSNMKPMF